MKFLQALLFCFLIYYTPGASAQRVFSLVKYSQMCSYYGEAVTGDIHAYKPEAAAESAVKSIMSVIGLKANFELRAANVPNAAAVILKGRRYILYNPKFMANINSVTGSDWAAISILAHEIGHHLNGHTLDNVGSRPQTELDADEFSGFVLGRLGASLADAQAVMGTIASMKGSHSHPPKKDRLIAIAAGWHRAGGKAVVSQPIVQTKTESKPIPTEKPKAITQPKQVLVEKELTREEQIKRSAQYDKNIASDAYFKHDPKGQYYLTVKGNLVQVNKDKVYLLAKLVRSNRAGYKMMLTDNAETTLYIDNGGGLINESGSVVGVLRARR